MADDIQHPLPHPLAPLASYACSAARFEGDWEPLIRLIREGGPITDDVRALLLDILQGKLKKPRGRARDNDRPSRIWKMALAVENLQKQGWKTTAAVAHVVKEFGTHTRTVQHAMASVAKERKQRDAQWKAHAARRWAIICTAKKLPENTDDNALEQLANELGVKPFAVRYAMTMPAEEAAYWATEAGRPIK